MFCVAVACCLFDRFSGTRADNLKVDIVPQHHSYDNTLRFNCQIHHDVLYAAKDVQMVHVIFSKWLRAGDRPIFEIQTTPDADFTYNADKTLDADNSSHVDNPAKKNSNLIDGYLDSVQMDVGRLDTSDVGTYFCQATVRYTDGSEQTGFSELGYISDKGEYVQ